MISDETNDKYEEILIDVKKHPQKIECYSIQIKTPKKIKPGSDIEERYLNYLVNKYANNEVC